MAELEIREIGKNEFSVWDKFVEESEQGTLFSTSLWMSVLNKYHNGKAKLLGIFKSKELISGILLYERKKAFVDIMAFPPLTPFTPLLFKKSQTSKLSKIESSQKRIIEIVDSYLIKNYNYVALQLEPSFKDIRPYLWLGWKPSISYTYEIDLRGIKWERIDKDAKYEISKARKNNVQIVHGNSMEPFLVLYEKTFAKQGSKIPLSKDWLKLMFETLNNEKKCGLYYAKSSEEIISSALTVWDNKRAYYLLAASEPNVSMGSNYMLLWHIIGDMSKRFNKIDLVGANIPDIVKFKREFATSLTSYCIVEKYSSFLVKILHRLYKKIT